MSIAVVFAWSTVSFAVTIFYTGLQVVPADAIEASSLVSVPSMSNNTALPVAESVMTFNPAHEPTSPSFAPLTVPLRPVFR